MKTVLSHEFPNVDLRNDGEFMEVFGLPQIKLFGPILSYLDRLRLMQSLENAELLTESEMDELGESFYIPRKTGFESYGVVIIVLNDLPETMELTIPAYSIEALSKQGLVFRNTDTIYITPENAPNYYDATNFNYKIPLRFESFGVGEIYNVEPGEINKLQRYNFKNFLECYNEEAFSGGVDTENNIDYAERIRNEAYAPNLGIKRGYQSYINNFDGVRESIIAGYGHPLMKRDIIGTVEIEGLKFNEGIKDLHWGTKIDIYIRGRKPEVAEEILEVEVGENGEKFITLTNKPVIDVLWLKTFSYTTEYDDPDVDEESLYVTKYSLVKEEDFETEGTLEEVARVVINDERVAAGSFIRIEYRYNELIQTIHDEMYRDENRPPTADVKLKEANNKVLYGGMVVKMFSSLGLRDNNRSYVKQKIHSWINVRKMGSELNFSDLLTPITTRGENQESIVEYIHLPYLFFMAENEDRYLFYTMNQTKRDLVNYFKEKMPKLGEIFEEYKDHVTVYDFFDFLHTMTYEENLENALEQIAYYDFEYGQKVDAFRSLRDMTLKSKATKRLSPPKFNIEEHCFYELGDLFLYEDVEYTEYDWQRMVDNLVSVAVNRREDVEVVNEMYYLAVYMLTMMYLSTTENVEERPEQVIAFVRALIERTPIEFNFD